MEWVETTGTTIEEAKDAALDQLGVDEQDAEFDVVEEPKTGLFGRVRSEARVRARVRPTRPRPKQERRPRRGAADRSSRSSPTAAGEAAGTPRERGTRGGTRSSAGTAGPSRGDDAVPAGRAGSQHKAPGGNPMITTDDDATVEEQAEIITGFLDGLVAAFGAKADVQSTRVDDDTIELQVAGDDLGLLIGPKGQTLMAVQELSRTVVQRQATGTHHGRVRLDIGGYRQHRREALERFARQVAEGVLGSGVQKALEPMNAADRKAVHDAVNEIDGVTTSSEGEEHRRRVVILPAD
ncbi:hypothetical protein BH20ACT2_BH20ACT2_18480 [soil metagenome]